MTDVIEFSAPFSLPPEGLLSEQVDLSDYRLSLGLQHIDGAGLRVACWNGQGVAHMSPAAARRWAKELQASEVSLQLLPVVRALNALADRIGEIAAQIAAQKLAEEPVQGHA